MNWLKKWRKRKQINSGWSNYGTPRYGNPDKKSLFSFLKKSWVDRKVINNINRGFNVKERIVKLIILVSLSIFVSKSKIKNKQKRSELIDRTYSKLSSRDFTFVPLATSFYLLLSFVPVVLIVTLFVNLIEGYGEISLNNIYDRVIPGLSRTINSIFPGDVSITHLSISAILQNSPGGPWPILVLILSLIWISSSGYSRLIYSMSYIYEHDNYGNILINRLKGMFIIIVIIFMLNVFLNGYVVFISQIDKLYDGPAYEAIFYLTFMPTTAIFYYLMLLFLFKFAPKFKLRFSHIQPGIFVALIPIWILTLIFQAIVRTSSFNVLSFMAVIFFAGTFVLFFSYFLYAGVLANEAYYKTFHSLRTVSKYTNRKNFSL
ncbi:YhjD/YihY/BrkB family envelope integrity protein [Mycoplasmopsis agassizii]|uniref:YhjD/YihY/BrkB family envelope integrity protein n=1 Tax=Mycoplasmopsis agassizii TaxID=33922 RepID=UPI0035271960